MKIDAPALATAPVTKPTSPAPITTGVEWRRGGFPGWVTGAGAGLATGPCSTALAPVCGLVSLTSLVMQISTSLVIGNRDANDRT
jgi:hypothetical protein